MKRMIVATVLLLSVFESSAESKKDFKVENLNNADKEIVVYRSPTCGCCGKWIEHLKKHDFIVRDNIIDDVQKVKDKYGVTSSLASCHTAIIKGYVIEGHVPASDIEDMLVKKENIRGLSVPGMVLGTPGMEMGGKKAPFKVIAFDKQGALRVYREYINY